MEKFTICLDKACYDAEIAAQELPVSPEVSCIGNVEDFCPKELADPGSNRVFVRESRVYFVAFDAKVHQRSVEWLNRYIEEMANTSVSLTEQDLKLTAASGRSLSGAPDVFGCTAVQIRYPDVRLDLEFTNGINKMTLMAGEVTFRNGGFKKAVTVAASYLMPWTNTPYSLVIVLHEAANSSNVESLEFILMRRRTQVKNITGAANPDQDYCRVEPHQLRRHMTSPEMEDALEVFIVRRVIVYRADVIDPDFDFTFQIPVQELCWLSGLNPGLFEGDSLTFDLREYCQRVFNFCDILATNGTYPYE